MMRFNNLLLIFLLLAVCTRSAYSQTMTNGDGSALTTRHCYIDTLFPIAGAPAGGAFSGCGISQHNGQWYFNAVAATTGVTVFPYQCSISYTVNGQSVSRSMLVYKPVVITPALKDSATCNGHFVLEANTLYAGAYHYQWLPVAPLVKADTSYTAGYIDQTQLFVITARDLTSGCQGQDSITITRLPVPEVTIVPDTITIRSRELVPLQASGAVLYRWLPARWLSNDTIADPVARPQAPVVYTVTGYNEYGCYDTATATIRILEEMYVPNAFSPNGDGRNDVFKVENIGYQGVEEFRIFNRWGQQIYETVDGTKGWDGYYKGYPADAGTYYYVIRLRLRDNNPRVFKGQVLLLR